MTRKYKLERLQKHILLGFSGVTLASTMFFGSAQVATDNQISQDTYTTETKIGLKTNEVKILNKAQKENLKFYQNHLRDTHQDID